MARQKQDNQVKKTVAKRKAAIAKKARSRKPAKKAWEKTYRPEYCQVVYQLCLLGLGKAKIAESLCVPETHIEEWKANIEEFRAAMVSGSEIADAKVAHSLFQRAVGYTHPETKVHFDKFGNVTEHEIARHYPPDTGAATQWLRIRQKDIWKDSEDINLKTQELPPLADLFGKAPEKQDD